jgi:hypothetical protein
VHNHSPSRPDVQHGTQLRNRSKIDRFVDPENPSLRAQTCLLQWTTAIVHRGSPTTSIANEKAVVVVQLKASRLWLAAGPVHAPQARFDTFLLFNCRRGPQSHLSASRAVVKRWRKPWRNLQLASVLLGDGKGATEYLYLVHNFSFIGIRLR